MGRVVVGAMTFPHPCVLNPMNHAREMLCKKGFHIKWKLRVKLLELPSLVLPHVSHLKVNVLNIDIRHKLCKGRLNDPGGEPKTCFPIPHFEGEAILKMLNGLPHTIPHNRTTLMSRSEKVAPTQILVLGELHPKLIGILKDLPSQFPKQRRVLQARVTNSQAPIPSWLSYLSPVDHVQTPFHVSFPNETRRTSIQEITDVLRIPSDLHPISRCGS